MNPQNAPASGSDPLLELKRHEAAMESCDKAIALKPDDAEAHKNRGNALLALKRHDAAIQSYDRAILLKPDYADAYYNRGNVLNLIGQHEAAIQSFDRAIALNPGDAEAYNNRGIALQALKQHEAAIRSFEQAIALNPGYVNAIKNRGLALQELRRDDEALATDDQSLLVQSEHQSATIAQQIQLGLNHHQLGRLPEAERFYQRALQIDPTNFEAIHLLGVIAHQVGRNEVAVQLIAKALSIKPDRIEALSDYGNALQELKRYDEALASYDQALALKPDYVDALNNRGNALQELERYDEALASYDQALSIRPDFAKASSNRGIALYKLKRYDEALASCNQTLSIKPDHAETLSNRGNTLQALKRYEEALACYERVLAIQPKYAEASYNRGNALQQLKRYEEALASYDQALAIKPDYAEALSDRGLTLRNLKRHDEALTSYDQALSLKPDYADAHWNEGLCRLLIGDFERGWEKYEWRWKIDALNIARRNFSQPLWLGNEGIAGKTILLHAEQGFGDTIQFARYAQAVAEKGARVILEVQPTLRPLLSDICGPYQVLSQGEPLPGFDFHCPLLSLPLAFNTRLESIPCLIPYLSARAPAVKKWKEKLGQNDAHGPRVGFVWSGNPAHKNDHNRSIALSRLVALGDLGVMPVSLQNAVRPEDERVLAANKHILHFGSELKDFSDTAALVSLMDLVISVDTSVAHLAGALGKPVWILLPFAPDWRWLVDREDSPWYPSARLFRQPTIGDWDSVIDAVRQQLRATLGENHFAARPPLAEP